MANMNNTMQTKQHAMKNNRTHIQTETRFTRDYFCGGRILSRKCSKSSIFVNSISWNYMYIKYILISRGAAFFCIWDI